MKIVAIAGLLVIVTAGPAQAAVSLTTSSSSISGWTLTATGTNTRSGGSVTVTATQPYTLTVSADRARLTEYSSGAYVSGGKTLGAPLNVIASRSSGSCLVVGVGATAIVSTTAATLATGVGSALNCTDSFSLTLSQLTAITDSALASGRSYHIVLTYTVQATL